MQQQEKNKLLSCFEQICAEKGDKIHFFDVAPILEGFIEVIEDAINDNDRVIYNELKHISTNIRQLKLELASNHPGKAIPGASNELDEVAKSIETAAHTILDTTEVILSIAPEIANEKQSQAITENATKILEACTFQDITGQRINKVLNALSEIESTTQKLLSLASDTLHLPKTSPQGDNRSAQLQQGLLDGPQASATAPSQDDIDNLFNKL